MSGTAIIKRYECGHREFTGAHYSQDGPFCGIDLSCAGLCTQCRADAFEEFLKTGGALYDKRTGDTYIIDDCVPYRSGSLKPEGLSTYDAKTLALAELADTSTQTTISKGTWGSVQRGRPITKRRTRHPIQEWFDVLLNGRRSKDSPDGED